MRLWVIFVVFNTDELKLDGITVVLFVTETFVVRLETILVEFYIL